MNKQNKFEDYMNNVFAPLALKIVIIAHILMVYAIALSFWKQRGLKMKENTKQKLFAAAVLVALLGGSWLLVKYGKYKVDETMYIHYHH